MEAWKLNLISVWLGCFFTGLAMSQILPFLPLYIEQLGVTGHQSLSIWSGLVFSGTFLVSALVSPLWGSLADRKGRKLMLLRASLGMAVVIALQGMVTNVYQLFALVASQVPRDKSGWALGTLSTGPVTGVIVGPLLGGLMADHLGLRVVFFVTAGLMFVSFLITLFLIKERRIEVKKADRLSGKVVFQSLPYPTLIVTLFISTLMIQLANSSISPILTLFIKDLSGDSGNIAFISGMIAAVPGVAALISAPSLGRLGDRIGTARILLAALVLTTVLFAIMAWVETPLQLGILRFLLGFADGALMPAVQTLLLKHSSDQVTGRIFGYNQSFMYLGNVVGPLIGSGVSALMGFRWVFAVTAVLVLINCLQVRSQFNKVEGVRK
ncbi:multidrug efflux MFS transporter [Serratia proteamaculans]|uniref:multidrug efflux MFS transporter n=1 Tax=Serratia proteamaculans TaxID=28151 RepID=UPI00217BEF00|nr:multidrug efflux MFS transporter [Serratia proteamaculans]CAI1085577.1 Tetracycline resistance protein, class C [Serratia proteamaculans]